MSTAIQPQAASSTSSSSSSNIIGAAKKRSSNNNGQQGTAKRTRLMRIIGRTLLGIMVLVGLSIIICWILVFPKNPVFTVESGHVTPYSLTDRKLNASISFSTKIYNSNKRASIHIDSMKMTLIDFGLKVSATMPNFSQLPGNQTVLNSTVLVQFVYPFGRMKELVQSDGVYPELRFSGKVSYVLERWTSKRRSMEIYCNHLRLKINGTTPFDNFKCTVDL